MRLRRENFFVGVGWRYVWPTDEGQDVKPKARKSTAISSSKVFFQKIQQHRKNRRLASIETKTDRCSCPNTSNNITNNNNYTGALHSTKHRDDALAYPTQFSLVHKKEKLFGSWDIHQVKTTTLCAVWHVTLLQLLHKETSVLDIAIIVISPRS